MNEKQKRILAVIAFVAVCGIAAFSYFFMNQGKSELASAKNDNPPVEEKQKVEENKAISEESSVEEGEQPEEVAETETEKSEGPIRLESLPLLRKYTVNNMELANELLVTKDLWSNGEPFSITQERYSQGFGFEMRYVMNLEFPIAAGDFTLSKKYTSLKGKVGVDDTYADSPDLFHIIFLGEDKQGNQTILQETNEFKGGDYPLDFDLDVTDVERLVIQIVRNPQSLEQPNTRIAFVDTQLQ
ncbi:MULTISPECIES: NPCBM/NEW2 domain-containing protein [Cytobacillus]|uniref:Glycosyl hydrolase family 98 putative carbohydrate-binding module domain-containing protein n=2 Tax=Bacillati TaxID=1783272 RepID=A0A2N0ZIG4_9BACI|nr:NPCBM/NEW2 domain-containing protein [Cytobacillus horneckiae]MEC1157723.1 NPCBM/NEW2 domain-containing protein [Cytobacillus horneckiae]PKG29293.1 hypothetical protein CWS20_09365 [Cytobacillus horneckiae]